jgi:hypothetical protein
MDLSMTNGTDVPKEDAREHERDDSEEEAESNHDSDSDSDASSVVSETSTLEYEQESFETFKEKCHQLALQLFPERTVKDIQIERMLGGSFHRVIGIKVYHDGMMRPSPQTRLRRIIARCFGSRRRKTTIKESKYILRIPRFSDDSVCMEYQIATMKLAASQLEFPVPSVHSFDTSEENALGKPYMVQPRLPGQALHLLWDELSLDQKKSAAQRITQIVLNLDRITYSTAGIVSRTNTSLNLAHGIQLETIAVPPIGQTGKGFNKPNTSPAKPQTTLEFLTGLCERWRDYEQAIFRKPHDHIWTGFINIFLKMHELGLLPDEEKFHLCHLDFQMRNILVEIKDSDVEVTGVLDWDSALFGPKFMAKRAPFFMWQPDDADDNEEQNAIATPQTLEEVECKKVFEQTVDAEFLRYAYGAEYIIARRIFHVLQRGIHSSTDLFFAKQILEDSQMMHPLPVETS